MEDRKKYKIINHEVKDTVYGEKRYWISLEKRGDVLCPNESVWLNAIQDGFIYADKITF